MRLNSQHKTSQGAICTTQIIWAIYLTAVCFAMPDHEQDIASHMPSHAMIRAKSRKSLILKEKKIDRSIAWTHISWIAHIAKCQVILQKTGKCPKTCKIV